MMYNVQRATCRHFEACLAKEFEGSWELLPVCTPTRPRPIVPRCVLGDLHKNTCITPRNTPRATHNGMFVIWQCLYNVNHYSFLRIRANMPTNETSNRPKIVWFDSVLWTQNQAHVKNEILKCCQRETGVGSLLDPSVNVFSIPFTHNVILLLWIGLWLHFKQMENRPTDIILDIKHLNSKLCLFFPKRRPDLRAKIELQKNVVFRNKRHTHQNTEPWWNGVLQWKHRSGCQLACEEC